MAITNLFATRKEAVAQQIRQDIVSCVLAPGATLRDNELAARYGVSTSPLREAIVQLASEHLIEMPANRPKRVTPLDRQFARDYFAIYKVIALAGFAWGAPKVKNSHIERMKSARESLIEAMDSGDNYSSVQHLRQFIFPVYEASGNPELLNMIMLRFSWLDRTMFTLHWALRREGIAYTKEILDCFLSGNASMAIVLHHQLINNLEELIARLPESWEQSANGDG